MPRPERPLRPDGGPISDFAHQLRILREKAGSPKYLQMARRTSRSRTALAEAAGGDHLPNWDTVKAFVEACGDDPMPWLPRWENAREQVREARLGAVVVPASDVAPAVEVPSSADDVTILLQLWQEQRDQARQCENHRAMLSAMIVVGCTAAAGASVVAGSMTVQVLSALVVVLFAATGALACHKYYERHQMHMNEAQQLRRQLDQSRPHLHIETTWSGSRAVHAARYRWAYRLRLHHLWVILHLLLAVVGIVLLVRLTVAGRS